jgi:voltage-gated potassium channel
VTTLTIPHFRARLQVPLLRRLAWHARRFASGLNRRWFVSGLTAFAFAVLLMSIVVTLLEKQMSAASLGDSFYWAVTTALGRGDATYVTSPAGRLLSWALILFGVTTIGAVTGALVAFVINFLLTEGQGMGAAGYQDHVVVCGWNATARDLIEEMRSDDYGARVVLIADLDRSPAGDGVYFIRGDAANTDELRRAGIEEAAAAIVCPRAGDDESDMHSILVLMAIGSLAPDVRTVAEVNNPRHAEHFRRAGADEMLVTSRLASRLLARSALYPGLTNLVVDIVSGGPGSELYRVPLDRAYAARSVDDVIAALRATFRATLVAYIRDDRALTNPPADLRVQPGDEAVVVAESRAVLEPLFTPPSESEAAAPAGQTAPAHTS